MSENTEENMSTPDLSSLVGGLLSNPETISKLASILSNLNFNNIDNTPPPDNNISQDSENISDNQSNNQDNNEGSSPTFQNADANKILTKIPQIMSQISANKCEESIATKQQIALLSAVRPYLSDHRKELIDTFIKMNRLGAIFKNLT